MPTENEKGKMPDEELEDETSDGLGEQEAEEQEQELEFEGEFDPERAKNTILKQREAERKLKRDLERKAKKLAELEKAEEERRRAEMSELEKLQADKKKLEAELKQRRINDTKRSIADEVGLPPELALRIQGSDEEEMRLDAEKLLDILPKSDNGDEEEDEKSKSKKRIYATNPTLESRKGETDEQRRKRLGLT